MWLATILYVLALNFVLISTSSRGSLASLNGFLLGLRLVANSEKLLTFRQSKKSLKCLMNFSVSSVSGSPKYAKASATDLLRTCN